MQIFFNCNLQDWIFINLSGITDKYWSSTWAIACHKFWYQKNQRKDNKDYVMPYNLKNNICREVARYKESCSLLKKVTQLRKVIQMIKWTPPNEAWFTPNTNGVVKKNKEAGCRGLIRDNSGAWRGGFSDRMGIASTLESELNAIQIGLHLPMIVDTEKFTMSNKNTLVNVEQKLSRDWDIRVPHVYREANNTADA